MHFRLRADYVGLMADELFVCSVNGFSVGIHKNGENAVHDIYNLFSGAEVFRKENLCGFIFAVFAVFFPIGELAVEYCRLCAAEIINALLFIADGEEVVFLCNQRKDFVLQLVCILKFVYIYFAESIGYFSCGGGRGVVFLVIKKIEREAGYIRKAEHMPALFFFHESAVEFIEKAYEVILHKACP